MDYGRVLEDILEDSGRFWAILARIATLEMAAFFCGCHFWVLSCLLLFFESILGKHSTWLYCLLLLALTCCCLLLLAVACFGLLSVPVPANPTLAPCAFRSIAAQEAQKAKRITEICKKIMKAKGVC